MHFEDGTKGRELGSPLPLGKQLCWREKPSFFLLIHRLRAQLHGLMHLLHRCRLLPTRVSGLKRMLRTI